MSEKITTNVARPSRLNNGTLADHIKAVGDAISNDAKSILIDVAHLRRVQIEAEIAPMEEVTTVTYTLERLADPRIHHAPEANNSEQ